MSIRSVFVVCLTLQVFKAVKPSEERSCKSDEFPCNDGSCIPKIKWCDTAHDCIDDSDENYCILRSTWRADPNRCGKKFFLCKDGPCIPLVGRCDGVSTCHDSSDEDGCVFSAAFTSAGTVGNATAHVTTVPPLSSGSPTLASSYSNTPVHRTTQHEVGQHSGFQSDSSAPKIETSMLVDITKDFVRLDSHYYIHEKSNAESWLLETRDAEFGWGDETARALTALYLSDPDHLQKNTDENKLMLKQLHLQISMALIRNQTKTLSLSELSSYINALHATCDNPKNFHGHNLVQILRHRTNIAQASGDLISPSVYLTLCISNSTTFEDVKKIQEALFGHPIVDKFGMHALMALATSCMDNGHQSSTHLKQQSARRMLNMFTSHRMPKNVYELALVMQALNEVQLNPNKWNRTESMRKLVALQQQNGSFGDVLATYYALPVLSGKSLASLAAHCSQDKENGIIPVEVLMNGDGRKDFVQYSLYFGKPVEVTHTLRLKVEQRSSILDIMRIAAVKNPAYRFKYDMTREKPFVYSIGGIVNDAEKGLYWTLEISSKTNTTDAEKFIPYPGDIRTFFPTKNDHIVFWLKHLY